MTTLRMTRGDAAKFDLVVRHPVTGEPVDLDGADVVMTAAVSMYTDEQLFSVTSDEGDIVPTPGEPGRALITVPAAATAELANEFHRLYFDVVVTDTDGPMTVDGGVLIVQPNVPVTVP